MASSPYSLEYRLQDVVAAIQLLALFPDYDLEPDKFRQKIARDPLSASDWADVFSEHPEFFRKSEHAGDYCLVLRRARPKDANGNRPPLESSELSLLIDTAIHLQTHALDLKKDRRAWLPLVVTGIGVLAAFAGTILGAMIKASSN